MTYANLCRLIDIGLTEKKSVHFSIALALEGVVCMPDPDHHGRYSVIVPCGKYRRSVGYIVVPVSRAYEVVNIDRVKRALYHCMFHACTCWT